MVLRLDSVYISKVSRSVGGASNQDSAVPCVSCQGRHSGALALPWCCPEVNGWQNSRDAAPDSHRKRLISLRKSTSSKAHPKSSQVTVPVGSTSDVRFRIRDWCVCFSVVSRR